MRKSKSKKFYWRIPIIIEYKIFPLHILRKQEGIPIILYVLNDKKYKHCLKQGILKYMPDVLLPKYKPQIVDVISLNEKNIGYIMGNNIKTIDFNDEKEVDCFLRNVQKLNQEDITTIYIEGCDGFNRGIFNHIETSLGYKFTTGDKIRIHNIELFLLRVSKLLNRELDKNDLLIVCEDKKRLIEIIKILPKELNCIANVGIDEDHLYEDILKETGISIYEPYHIEKAIKNFHIIINYGEETYFDITKIRNQGVVLDFSSNRSLKGIKKLNKNIIYIEDFNFPSKLDTKWIDPYISSRLYETIYGGEVEKFRQICTEENYWYLDQYFNMKIKIRGRV